MWVPGADRTDTCWPNFEPLHLTEAMRNMIRVFYDVTIVVGEPYV
jgi:hypothetical protein